MRGLYGVLKGIWKSFARWLPIETICMHGSPLSRYDNRKIWEKYNYRDYGIIGEPYFDVDFRKVLVSDRYGEEMGWGKGEREG